MVYSPWSIARGLGPWPAARDLYVADVGRVVIRVLIPEPLPDSGYITYIVHYCLIDIPCIGFESRNTSLLPATQRCEGQAQGQPQLQGRNTSAVRGRAGGGPRAPRLSDICSLDSLVLGVLGHFFLTV